jgi:CBS domain containing-hemolysin-like protein
MTVVSTLISIVVTVILVTACFLTAAVESSVRVVPPHRARRLRDSAERGADAFEELVEHPARLGGTHALISGVAFASVAAIGSLAFEGVWLGVPQWADVAVGVAVGVIVVFALGEALPRAFAAANPEDIGLALAPGALVITIVVYPVARALSAPFTAAMRLITGERSAVVPWADISEAHRTGDEDEQASEEAEAMMDAFVGLERKVVREVMVPRTDMVAIEDTATLEEALAAITAAGVSRVPVFHDTLDDISGVLYAKDLLPALAAAERDVRLSDLARPALFVPETKPVDDLLREMRRRTHIALVADEHGGTAGLVTIEDLLEEIVGEIYDEYDPEVAMVTTLPDGRVRVDGRLDIDEIDELFGTMLETEADTAAGLFTELAGHIPATGESVEVQGLKFTVETMEGNRVRQLVVEPVAAREDEETHE